MRTQMSNELTQHWVSVVDEQGREQLEARWFAAGQPVQVVHAA